MIDTCIVCLTIKRLNLTEDKKCYNKVVLQILSVRTETATRNNELDYLWIFLCVCVEVLVIWTGPAIVSLYRFPGIAGMAFPRPLLFGGPISTRRGSTPLKEN